MEVYKRMLLTLFMLFVFISFLSCNQEQECVNEMTWSEKQDVYAKQIEEDDITKQNVEIIAIKRLGSDNASGFEEAVLYRATASDPIATAMYLSYATPKGKSVIIGGGGPAHTINENDSLTYSTTWGTSNQNGATNILFLAYGLVHDDNIEEVEVVFEKGKVLADKVDNGGFILAYMDDKEGVTGGVEKIVGKDKNKNIVYEFPSE